MKILVTGATGYIGSALCHRLLSQGHELLVFTRNITHAQKHLGTHNTEFYDDLDVIPDNKVIDVIINLSGEPILFKRWTKRRKKILEDSRIGVTDQLLALIRRLDKKPKTLLSGSAVGYYGDRGDRKLTETSHGVDEFGHRLCAAWESRALMAKAYDVRVCIIRIGVVIGQGGGFIAGMLRPFKLGLGGKIGSGRQWMSWIHRDDLINGVEFLLSRDDLDGIFNATSPLPVTNAYFTALFAKLLRRPAFIPIPTALLILLLGENSEVLLGGQRVFPKALQDAGFEFQYPDLKSALHSVV